MAHLAVNGRLLPTFFVLVCIIPTFFGTYRIFLILTQGPILLSFLPEQVDNLPLLLHVIGGVGFLTLGALQILPGFRSRNLARHRALGRITASLGVLAGISGVWMTLLHQEISGPVLFYGRLMSGTAWTVFILISIRFVIRRNITRHRNWMLRAYAIALPAGTLAFFMLPIVLIFGEEGNELLFEWVQVVAWPVHLAIAEAIIRRPARLRGRPMALPAE